MVSGMCCAGGVLIERFEKIGREQSRLFFVVGFSGRGMEWEYGECGGSLSSRPRLPS